MRHLHSHQRSLIPEKTFSDICDIDEFGTLYGDITHAQSL